MSKNRHPLIALLLALPLALSACAGGGNSGSQDAYAPQPQTLQIYSSQHVNVTKALAEGFTAKTGIKTQVRDGEDASMGHMIVKEGDASPADVFLTENSPAMTVVERAGRLAPVQPATLAQAREGLAPSSGLWTPIAARSTVLVYNKDKISEADLPKSMMDLADPKWAGKWGAAPGGADFQAIVAGMLAERGEQQTRSWLEALTKNAKVYNNNIATMKAVNAGEVPVGIMYHYYWYRDQAGDKQGSANTALHFFGGGDPGAFVSLSAGGVLASSDMPEQAQQFLAYVTGPEGQRVMVDSGSMEYAIGKGVPSDPALPPLDSLQAPAVDASRLNSDDVISLMTDVGIL
ncbi:iron(III) transport system substrate-binding protein [Raineyella antarctica]|uniref:Iron(III) transport system substrate-binding protein n=1 Tax=Raineyella antarctica TaxID=1577474 RepID=A0A1G6I3V5_9ACTN|nr:extracellular solute-binding protein [Raineyella antarctica]SDC01174.1 iron(III) transport system substrate-binding protein [Raineyella antarctica]